MKLYVDTAGKTFAATYARDWRGANPDLIDFSQVMACDLDIIEHKEEQYREVNGKRESYDPPRYTYEYEFQMDLINKNINPELETMFLTASGKYTFLSSSVVREMARYGADLTGLVPNELKAEIEEKAKQGRQKHGA
jgi:hypothetical protein